MENLNLFEILKNVPKGTKLYSPICGECKLAEVRDVDGDGAIKVQTRAKYTWSFAKNGHFLKERGECLLFPSKDNRDWLTFKVEKETFAIVGDHVKNKEVITHTLQRIRDLVTTRKNIVGVEMSNESVMNVVSVLAKDTLEYIDKYWEKDE